MEYIGHFRCSIYKFILIAHLKFHILQIRDLRIADREEDIGYYAGFIGKFLIF